MKNLLFIILLLTTMSCATISTKNYKIEYLESGNVGYSNKLLAFEEYPEDCIVYEYINGRYVKIIQIYE